MHDLQAGIQTAIWWLLLVLELYCYCLYNNFSLPKGWNFGDFFKNVLIELNLNLTITWHRYIKVYTTNFDATDPGPYL